MSMVTRDILAATLLTAGVASLSCGAALITPAAGLIVLGALLAALGATLGFWEGGATTPGPTPEPVPEPVLTPAWDLDEEPSEVEGREDAITYLGPPPGRARNGPPGPAEVPFGSYLGVRSKEEAR